MNILLKKFPLVAILTSVKENMVKLHKSTNRQEIKTKFNLLKKKCKGYGISCRNQKLIPHTKNNLISEFVVFYLEKGKHTKNLWILEKNVTYILSLPPQCILLVPTRINYPFSSYIKGPKSIQL